MSKRALLRIFIIIAALGFIIFGVFREEAVTVLNKAIYICLECIGIG